jgi:hypothetical protein
MTRWTPILRFTWLLGLAACSIGCENLARPNWTHPGPAQVQEARAIRYDPYPEPDIGPNVEGVRPRSYDKPLAETERGRWYLGDWQ